MSHAYFRLLGTAEGERLEPNPLARSGWGDQIRGTAVSGALARATEHRVTDLGRADLRLVRWTVDMFRPAAMKASTTRVEVVRAGRRVCLLDAVLEQEGVAVARSRGLFLATSARPPGEVWAREPVHLVPPADLAPIAPEFRIYHTEQDGWSHSAAEHQNGSRKRTWHLPMLLVEGEEPTPLEGIATIADVTNMITNWGSAGVQFINVDVDLALVRLPRPDGVGLATDARFDADGVAVGTALVYDRDGAFGMASITALANGARFVDVANRWTTEGVRDA